MNQNSEKPEIKSFADFDLPSELPALLKKSSFAIPTAVQVQSIPLLLSGADGIIIGQTGTGKTLAYVLPMVTLLLRKPEARGLVLAPTREMAEQIYRVIMTMTSGLSISTVLIMGGTANKVQASQLKKKPRVIVATPGRLNDHLLTNKLLLQSVQMIVIDEADRMLDMGFAPQLESIRKTLRGIWQTAMVSASLSRKIETVAKKFMQTDAVVLRTEGSEEPVEKLRQKVFFVDRGMKNERLASELKSIRGQVLVFAGNQPSCEEVGHHLKQNGFLSDFIHGGLNTGHRSRVLREFRDGKIQIMITTDLLARGLDVPLIECVINYDLPSESEDFLHRIGRTARAGAKGKALTFVTPRDRENFEKIRKFMLDAEEVRLN